MYGEEEYYYKMVDAGAKGFLLKDSDISEVKEAILTVEKEAAIFHRNCFTMLFRRSNTVNMKANQPTFQKEKRRSFLKYVKDFQTRRLLKLFLSVKELLISTGQTFSEKQIQKIQQVLILFAIRNKLIEI